MRVAVSFANGLNKQNHISYLNKMRDSFTSSHVIYTQLGFDKQRSAHTHTNYFSLIARSSFPAVSLYNAGVHTWWWIHHECIIKWINSSGNVNSITRIEVNE